MLTQTAIDKIFLAKKDYDFNKIALEIFKYQFEENQVYNKWCTLLNRTPQNTTSITQIPFLPVEFFKTKEVVCSNNKNPQAIFTSSGTTGNKTSKHYVKDINIYHKSLIQGFEQFYGLLENYTVLALLPSYLEREGSSLVVMVEKFLQKSKSNPDGFFLYDFDGLQKRINKEITKGKKILLIGVTFALIDFAQSHKSNFGNQVIVMETGGMKGRRKEMVRQEVHKILKDNLGIETVHSEYGMTELLSQAYSKGNGIYWPSNTMKILIRETTDPLKICETETIGGINIIDLSNIYSCSFIATQDLGLIHNDGSFEVLGRFDNSDTRGCNLLYTK